MYSVGPRFISGAEKKQAIAILQKEGRMQRTAFLNPIDKTIIGEQTVSRKETKNTKQNQAGKRVLVVVDTFDQWAPYYSSESVVTVAQYLQDKLYSDSSYLVINLCSDLSYLSEGYYCSLLAQARKHKVLPSIETLNRLHCTISLKTGCSLPAKCSCMNHVEEEDCNGLALDLFLGKPEDPALNKFARTIFESYPAPLLRAIISPDSPNQIIRIRNLTLEELDDHQQDLFADSLDQFSKKVWRTPRNPKPARYDLAIFHDPREGLPPSNKKALDLFVSEGKKMGINAELVTEEDSGRLLEFDALFIRQTTAVDNITYRLAQAAEQADMVVIDDPSSIVRCTNKVFLKEFLDHKSIPSPRSQLLFCKNPPSYDELAALLGHKMVLKVPDGSFSVGIHKAESETQYRATLQQLCLRSSVLLAQEFLPTDYDWRICVLNGEAIFACKYYMARGHWQIYRHSANGTTRSGKFETLPVHLVPRRITKLAEKASAAIGKGFYGVDLKETEDGLKVIEINDNPSIDHGVEDRILGAELYRIILREIVARLDAKRNQ